MARGLGTFKVGDLGVTLSRGRGANKTVVLDVSFKELEKWAAWNRVNADKVWQASFARACKNLKSKFAKILSKGGGVEGVPKFKDFEEFTKELRAIQNKSNAPMGGILAEKSSIVSYKIGNTQYIGWPDRLAEWAVNFQDGVGGKYSENKFTDPYFRAQYHRMGIKDVPHEYVHNPRRIIPEPFGSYVDRYLEEWARAIYYKQLARAMTIQKKL